LDARNRLWSGSRLYCHCSAPTDQKSREKNKNKKIITTTMTLCRPDGAMRCKINMVQNQVEIRKEGMVYRERLVIKRGKKCSQ